MARGTQLIELVDKLRAEIGHSQNVALGQNVVQGFKSVLKLGIHHIAEGTDHLLFLLVLLLPAPLLAGKARWKGFGGWKEFLQAP